MLLVAKSGPNDGSEWPADLGARGAYLRLGKPLPNGLPGKVVGCPSAEIFKQMWVCTDRCGAGESGSGWRKR